MNVVILVGTVQQAPQQRGDNTPVNLRVETARTFTNKDGEVVTYNDRHDVVAWRDKDIVLALQEGQLVEVRGAMQTRSYTNRDGNKVWTTEVNADSVQALAVGSAPVPARGPTSPAAEDDIPF